MKLGAKWRFAAFALGYVSCLQAQSLAWLWQRSGALETAYALARDYQYGLGTPSDLVQSYAWMKVYVDLLPSTYPRKCELLQPIKGRMQSDEIKEARVLSDIFKRKHHLTSGMDEQSLTQMFYARAQTADVLPDKSDRYQSMSDFFGAVSEQVPEQLSALKAFYRAQQRSDRVLVYGQVQLNGRGLPEQVAMGSKCRITAKGFFMCSVAYRLTMRMNGYISRSFMIGSKSDRSTYALGQRTLHKLPTLQTATLVGHVSSKHIDIEALSLRLLDQQSLFKQKYDNPWSVQPLPVTLLANGQFYAKGLSLGRYQLLLKYHGKQYSHSCLLSHRGIKVLSDITL